MSLFRILLLLIVPMLAFPQNSSERELPPIDMSSKLSLLHYDDVLDWIEAIENDELEERYTPEQIEEISIFLTCLAWNGAASNHSVNPVLQQDIQTLLRSCTKTGGWSILGIILAAFRFFLRG